MTPNLQNNIHLPHTATVMMLTNASEVICFAKAPVITNHNGMFAAVVAPHPLALGDLLRFTFFVFLLLFSHLFFLAAQPVPDLLSSFPCFYHVSQ